MAQRGSGSLQVKAKKSLGQNFLNDPHYLERIIASAELTSEDLVLEIGPGQGSLTRELAARAAGLMAVELDDRLITPLRAMFATQLGRIRIVHGDILELDPAALIDDLAADLPGREPNLTSGAAYKVVANLPYYITSAVLRQLLEARRPPTRAVVLVQVEVAQRICARPGDMSLLAASVQYYAQPQLVDRVPAGAFRPIPKVDSAILRLDVYPQPAVDVPAERFFTVVRAGFGQKRKQLLNSLTSGLSLPKQAVVAALECAGIDPMRRAETLALPEWSSLCHCLERV